MTVKKRLSRSNILMIILPIIISLVLTWLLMELLYSESGFESPRSSQDDYELLVRYLQRVDDKWSAENGISAIVEDLDAFCLDLQADELSLLVYREAEQIYAYGDLVDTLVTDISSAGEGQYTMSQELFMKKNGDYSIFLLNNRMLSADLITPWDLLVFWLLAAFIVIVVVFSVNKLLTRHVFHHITEPLNLLVEGVHELRDGKLDYRIHYDGQDEFAEVCSDFNDMAQQLSDLMEARKRDDENRRELVAGISHDLRTPLTSIKAYVEGLQEGVANTPALKIEYLNTIQTKADDLEHIVQQLFQYSKLDIGAFPFKMENVDFGLELEQYIQRVADEYCRKGLIISFGENVKGAMVMVDRIQLRTVFTNILENAIKYGSEDEKRMIVQCRREGGKVQLSFRDNGPGVNEEALSKLFNAFYRNDRSRRTPGQGSGLGLSISAKIIERFSGTIGAENAIGGGLNIRIALPIIGGNNNE